MRSRIAIITARGGSKRIPKKNIKLFLGKPIICYSIEAAISAGCFHEIMVSTDDAEIAEISKKLGARVPFFRSETTSDDHSGTADVLREVLEQYQKNGAEFDQACCIYPTAPFVTAEFINRGLSTLDETNADSVIPIAKFTSPIWRGLKIEEDRLQRIWPEFEQTRSQDLPVTYFDPGQFYWLNVHTFLESNQLLTNNTASILIPSHMAQDIDSPEDWAEAEIKYKILQNLQSA